jgi:hypothetical protein
LGEGSGPGGGGGGRVGEGEGLGLGDGPGSGDGDGFGEGCGPGPGLGSMPGGGSPPPNVMDPPLMGKSRIGSEPPLPPPFPSSLVAAVVEASSPCPSACGSMAMYGTPPSLSTTVNAPPRSAGVLLSPLTARSPVRRISPAMTAARPRTKRRNSAILQRVIPNLASNTTYAPDAVRTRLYRRPSLKTVELMGLGRKASTPLRYLLAPPSRLQQPLYAFGVIRRLGRAPFPKLLSNFIRTPWIRTSFGCGEKEPSCPGPGRRLVRRPR